MRSFFTYNNTTGTQKPSSATPSAPTNNFALPSGISSLLQPLSGPQPQPTVPPLSNARMAPGQFPPPPEASPRLDADAYHSLVRQAHGLQSRRLSRLLNRRVAASRVKQSASERLMLALESAEELEDRARGFWEQAALGELGSLEEQVWRLRSRLQEHRPSLAEQPLEERLESATGRARRLHARLADSAVREWRLREANERLHAQVNDHVLRDRALRSEVGEARAAQTRAAHELHAALVAHPRRSLSKLADDNPGAAAAAALPELMRSCADELLGSGSDAPADAWAEDEAALIQALHSLARIPPSGDRGPEAYSGESDEDGTQTLGLFGSRSSNRKAVLEGSQLFELQAHLESLWGRLDELTPNEAGKPLEADTASARSTAPPSTGGLEVGSTSGHSGSEDTRKSQWLLSSRSNATDSSLVSPSSTGKPPPHSAEHLKELAEQLADENESLQRECEAAGLAEPRESGDRAREGDGEEALSACQQEASRLATQRDELTGRSLQLRSEVKRLRSEWRDVHRHLSGELSRVLALREELLQERASEQRLEREASVAEAVAAGADNGASPHAAATASGALAREHAAKLKAELASAYDAIAQRLLRQQEAEALRQECARLDSDNAALRAAVSAEASPSGAGQGVLAQKLAGAGPRRPAASAATFARLSDGKQVELTGKIQRQVSEIADLREKLRQAEQHRAQTAPSDVP